MIEIIKMIDLSLNRLLSDEIIRLVFIKIKALTYCFNLLDMITTVAFVTHDNVCFILLTTTLPVSINRWINKSINQSFRVTYLLIYLSLTWPLYSVFKILTQKQVMVKLTETARKKKKRKKKRQRKKISFLKINL